MAQRLISTLSNHEYLQKCLLQSKVVDLGINCILTEKQEIGQNIYGFMLEGLRAAVK